MKKLLLVSIAIILGIGAVSAEAAKGGKILKLRNSIAKQIDDSASGIGSITRHELAIIVGKTCEHKRSEAQPGQDPELLVCQCVAERVLAKLNEAKKSRLEKSSNEIPKTTTNEAKVDSLKILNKGYEEQLFPNLDDLVQQCLAAEKPREYRDGSLMLVSLVALIIVVLMIWARLARKKH